MAEGFRIVLRGYDRREVDRVLQVVDTALVSRRELHQVAARQAVRSFDNRRVLRGYSRKQVDLALRQAMRTLSE